MLQSDSGDTLLCKRNNAITASKATGPQDLPSPKETEPAEEPVEKRETPLSQYLCG
jgi:hypothetical protein